MVFITSERRKKSPLFNKDSPSVLLQTAANPTCDKSHAHAHIQNKSDLCNIVNKKELQELENSNKVRCSKTPAQIRQHID